MGGRIINLAVVIVGGVILANMIVHASGTKAFFDGVGGLWKTSINGLLGSTTG